MAAGAGDAGLRWLPYGDDRISALPDELIQAILAWLPSAAAAARTSVLSRRWRRVWTAIPALSFLVERREPPGAAAAALGAYSASATLNRLAIHVDPSSSASRDQINSWLRFASLRLAGELRLSLGGSGGSQWVLMLDSLKPPEPQELELPACGRATRIDLAWTDLALRLPAAGDFAALRVLKISVATLAGDVGRLVSKQCPRLRELEMCDVTSGGADITIYSASLERLVLRRVNFLISKGRIDVVAPGLYYLVFDNNGVRPAPATIATAMLAEVIWNHGYDPSRHNLVGADRRIYRLEVTYGSNAAVFKRFDAVDELCLRLSIPPVNQEEYRKFLEDMNELPDTRVLEVKWLSRKRHLESTMLHLLRKHSRLRKIKIGLSPANWKETECAHGCRCVPPKSWSTDDVILDSLEEVEISNFTGDVEDVQLLKLLFRCKIMIRRLAIRTASGVSLSREMQERIWGFAPPHCRVLEFETTQFIPC